MKREGSDRFVVASLGRADFTRGGSRPWRGHCPARDSSRMRPVNTLSAAHHLQDVVCRPDANHSGAGVGVDFALRG